MTLTHKLSTSYSAPLAHLCILLKAPETCIEAHESYQKQSFRNRMYIATSSGIQMLNIPIEHVKGQSIKDTKIAYREPWARNHFRTLQTCYNSAPYFIYYCDEIENALNTNYKYLFDLNQHLLHIICKVIHVKVPETTSG
ncbi:MAG: WbqC family protein [Bacteroidia bacterium]